MSQPTSHWKLGLFVLLSLGAVMVTLAWLGARSLQQETTELHVFFDQDVTGLEVGAPLGFRGIRIGRVTSIRAAPDRRHVEVLVEVFLDSLRDLGFLAPADLGGEGLGSDVPEDLRVQLVKSFITGVSTLESDFVDVDSVPVPEYPFPVPVNTLHPVPSSLNQLEKALVESFTRLPVLLDQTKNSLTRLEGAIAGLDTVALSDRADQLLTTLEEQIAAFYESVFVREGSSSFVELKDTLAEFKALIAELRSEDGPLLPVLARYDRLGAHLDEAIAKSDLPATFEAVRSTSASFTETGDTLDELGRGAQSELAALRETLRAARRLLELLERDPAALLRGR